MGGVEMQVVVQTPQVALDLLRSRLLSKGFDPEQLDSYIEDCCIEPIDRRVYCEYLDLQVAWE